MSDLVNCHVIVAASLLYLYESFVAVCREENGSQVRADSYLYLVLASLPWVTSPRTNFDGCVMNLAFDYFSDGSLMQ